MSFNKDELQAPDWVNANFAKKVIEKSGEAENVNILNYKITPGTAAGDHFASIMFRVQVNFAAKGIRNESISLIVKTLPVEDGLKKDMLTGGSMNLFQSEAFIYSQVLNESKRLLNACGYKDLLAPRLLYYSMESPKVLVFEDLKEMGYTMIPHNIPTEDEVMLIYSKLAKYHATTFKMGLDGRKDLQSFKGTFFGFSFMKQFDALRNGPSLFTELLESIPGFEKYAKKMRKLTYEILWEKCAKVISIPGPYSVLNHGDYHTRNMMFKKNARDVISEVVLVDFQCPHWGSPGYDLVYMGAIIPPNLRDIAFRHYFNVFTDAVVKLGYTSKLPTYKELQDHLEHYACIDLLLVASFSVFIYMDKSNSKISEDLETLLSDSESRKRFYHNPDYVAFVKQVAPKLLDAISID